MANGTDGLELTYAELLEEADSLSRRLLEWRHGGGGGEGRGLEGERIAILTPNDHHYACALFGIWHAGGVAVPLYPKHPPAEMRYYLEDSKASAVIAHPSLEGVSRELGTPTVSLSVGAERAAAAVDPEGRGERPVPVRGPFSFSPASSSSSAAAMILFTSGTTGRPKGVVLTHANLEASAAALAEAWEWAPGDRIPHFLPLHHVHGVVNKLLCALWTGGAVEWCADASPSGLWRRLGDPGAPALTLFMAVPTVYARMLEAFDGPELGPREREAALAGARRLRLMVSGSAACPAPLFERWRALTGQTLLERYGMTEVGMALSNPYRGRRNAGYVGTPLPGVSVRIVDVDDESGEEAEVRPESGEQGELRVKGPGVFKEYWPPGGDRCRICYP